MIFDPQIVAQANAFVNALKAGKRAHMPALRFEFWQQFMTKGIKTAHDALSPETERKQARSIWAMGKTVSKTAIGRAFLKGQGLADASVTARIIPPTRKYPQPHLALPAFDGNGKAAGLTLVPLLHEKGVISPGKTRQLATESAQAAILQKSRSGETLIVSDLAQGLAAARDKPDVGVLLLPDRI